jgi:hypothetical protein
VTDEPKKPLIASRVLIVGEQIMSPEEMTNLEDRHLQIFMREPDPELWPPEMGHLAKYLPAEERIAFDLSKIIPRHENIIDDPLREWTRSVLRDLGEGAHRQTAASEMVRYLENLVTSYIEKTED